MVTLEAEDVHSDDHRWAQKAKHSIPEEIIEEILSILPVKSILRFKSVCKPWLSLISNSSFTKLYSAAGHRTTALFFSAFDASTNTRYFFSGARDGGSVVNLIKLTTPHLVSLSEHLNGLVCFTTRYIAFSEIYAYVFNPSTHKFFKLPHRVSFRNYGYEKNDMFYLFGFDESSNDHKVLFIDFGLTKIKPTTIEVMIFSMATYSWRKINVDLPPGMSDIRWCSATGASVCVNSTIHMMLQCPLQILAFDLRKEEFSIVNVPHDAMVQTMYVMIPHARFIKINGLLGVASIDFMEGLYEVDIWMLQAYENQVWVRETITVPLCKSHGHYPCDSINMDEIIFTPKLLYENLMNVTIYNMKTKCFNSVQLTLGHRFLCPNSLTVERINCYVESLIPLQN
ncbi:putative F-box domain-containing protein [Helianthus annuus]|uniref:F-box domain-containing protein n=1 Tax=Helianthus annuus TaxID=4232 RepID=A0A251URF5_HELAN|nr:F-box protein At1g30790 isoform X1 [Helianthus annuus]KAF5805937.1 putative F-box domain-containing protein [Helianthus annuus]KAJ0570326.1 putative F-box domain-containing protein [Helianthus annuus]KAJ0577065.1 putative F-box domain-containing protein [Helianthus annuus]KAJ0584620.1 putative F-box domain-containing protein [Helianthus annuus]KAJ0747229.1 putative F-box domain-containing protein [Helianthus annuus]